MKRTAAFFSLLFALLIAARLCHVAVLWAEEGLPMAAARQMAAGSMLYRDAWFDKPPLLAATYLLWGVRDGWPLRLAGALYSLLACALAYRFARGLWGPREGFWAAGLMAFALTFYVHSAVIPLAADLLMLAPHLAAVWLAWKGRAFWSGVLAGVAFLVNAKGVFVLAACALWNLRALAALAAGFAIPNALALAWLWWEGALAAYILQVWQWGRVYAGGTFVREPLWNGLLRSLNWMGFHAAIVLAALYAAARDPKGTGWRWTAWAALSLAAVTLGWRFFPRYFFQLLPVAVLLAAHGFVLLGPRRRVLLALLLVVPLVRFGPRYVMQAERKPWADTAMDQDSRRAASLVRAHARPGDTLFVWGFRPELYVYTDLPAGTRFLDSQPLTGVPADRHLTQSSASAADLARINRDELIRARPTFVLDGLGPYNPRLAIETFPDLRTWLAGYTPVDRTMGTKMYQLSPRLQ